MDPHLEEMPDHAGPFYQAIRDVLIQKRMPAEQAIQALDNSWNLNHDALIHQLCIDICKLIQFLKHRTCQYVASMWGLLSRVGNNTEANRGCTEVCRGVPNCTEMG